MTTRIFAVALLAIGCARGDEGAGNAGEGRGRVEVGHAVPAYRATGIDGDSVSLAQFRGRVLLLNVWATWCHPCREEIPQLRALHEKYSGKGLALVGVSVDASGNDDGIRAFMREFEMRYPVWLDPDERISTEFLIVGVPATFLIDRQGVLRWRKTGPVQGADTTLIRVIEAALAG